jgi:ribosomal protein S3AE
LRNLARTDVPNRAELIKRNVDLYLKDETGGRQRGLERLRLAIHNEESERREGEDWSVAKDYVRSLQNMVAD